MKENDMTQQERVEAGLPQFALQPVEYTLPAYWASYLINGDDSGIDEKEKAQADQFLADKKLPMPVSCSDEQYFKWGNDATTLGGDVLEYTFLLPVSNS